MDIYVLTRTDGKYVAKPGSKKSYTTSFTRARKFETREQAEQDRCVENECVEIINPLYI